MAAHSNHCHSPPTAMPIDSVYITNHIPQTLNIVSLSKDVAKLWLKKKKEKRKVCKYRMTYPVIAWLPDSFQWVERVARDTELAC